MRKILIGLSIVFFATLTILQNNAGFIVLGTIVSSFVATVDVR